MRAERRAFVVIIASRSLSAAVGVAAIASVINTAVAGREPIPLVVTSVATLGLTLVLAAILRERGTVRQSAALTAIVIGAAALWSLALPLRSPDALAILTRVIAFGILGEAYLWRLLGVVRGLQRWREVRNDALLSLFAVVVAAVAPGAIDRDALPVLGVAVAVAGAAGLSLARSAEELSFAGGQTVGRPAPTAATGTAFALGALALAVAVVLPTAQVLLAQAGRAVGPVAGQVLFTLLLPLGYVAAWFVYAALWLKQLLGIGDVAPLQIPQSPFANDDELARRLREMDETRPLVFGAVEVLIGLVALAFAVALIARLVSERRALVSEGVDLEREPVEGIGLGATLVALLPRRRRRPRPPVDDGSAAGRLRRLYWRLLELADRDGPGRRAPAETPAEHEERLLRAAQRWSDASTVVRAFEDLRYGERDPDPETVERSVQALRRLEAAR